MTVFACEEPAGLRLTVEYNTGLFEGSTIERMLGHFQTLLKEIVADPGRRIGRLPILTESERQQLLVDWNDTRTDYPRDRCIHALFEEQVERTPDAVAVVYEDQQLTYLELNRRANQLAHFLRRFGVGPEVCVGVCMERGPDMAVGLLAILKAGGAYVPLDPTYPQERLAFILDDSDVEIIVSEGLPADACRREGRRSFGWTGMGQASPPAATRTLMQGLPRTNWPM